MLGWGQETASTREAGWRTSLVLSPAPQAGSRWVMSPLFVQRHVSQSSLRAWLLSDPYSRVARLTYQARRSAATNCYALVLSAVSACSSKDFSGIATSLKSHPLAASSQYLTKQNAFSLMHTKMHRQDFIDAPVWHRVPDKQPAVSNFETALTRALHGTFASREGRSALPRRCRASRLFSPQPGFSSSAAW